MIEPLPVLSSEIRAQLDRGIRDWSARSCIAPAAFLEPELRREMTLLVRDLHFLISPERIGELPELAFRNYDRFGERLEQEYLCYFQRDDAPLQLENSWKSVYAGCNSQIERFLRDNGLEEALQEIGIPEGPRYIEDEFPLPRSSVKNSRLPDPIRLYFTGIGYLYPDGKRSLVHPNLLLAQFRPGGAGGDTPFLTRDLIRAPYLAVERERKLTGEKMWEFWRTLVTLAYAGLPEYEIPHIGDTSGKYNEYLQHGARLVPKRYLELHPVVETFDWPQD